MLMDMFVVRDVRRQPDTPRFGAGSAELTFASYLMTVPPKYPRSAVSTGAQGRVMAKVCVDARGKPWAAIATTSSGHAELDRAALEVIPAWRFRPSTCGGKPQDTWVSVPLEFTLRGGGARPLRADPDFFRHRFGPAIGLDPEGYTVVVEQCEVQATCSANAVPPPGE